jgi:hypothetical protein
MKLIKTCLYSAAFVVIIATSQPTLAQLHDDFVIDYTDLERYDQALDAIEAGADPEATFLDYYRGGGTGIKLWLERANATPERAAAFMAKRVGDHPVWARIPYGYAATLKKHEDALRSYYTRLQALFPDDTGPILPTYFVVAVLNGSGSWELTGNYITIGAFSAKPGKSLSDIKPGVDITEIIDLEIDPAVMLQTAVHELVHYFQMIYQGLSGYQAMYRDKQRDTNMARAAREGVADFIADLAIAGDVVGLESVHARTAYFYENEAAIWDLFEPVAEELNNDDNGWFYGVHPEKPEMPFQIGYSLGREMARAYYEHAEDKVAAVRFLLSANDAAAHQAILAAYQRDRTNDNQ